MNKRFDGRSTQLLMIDSLSVHINSTEVFVKSIVPFFLEVSYYWEPEIKATEDEPHSPEYVEIFEARLILPLYLSNEKGVTMSIGQSVNIINILYEHQYEELVKFLTTEDTGGRHL